MSCSEWKEYRLEEACNISTGFAFKSKEYLDNGKYKVVRGDNVKTGFIYWEEKSRYWNDLTDRLSKYILQEKDIVIGMDGSRVGKNRAIISENDLPAILAQRVACVRAKADFSQDYIRYVIMSNTFEYYVDSIKTGTSIPHISMKQIGEFKFKAPSLEIQEKIANVLSSLDDKIELNNEMNKTLEEMAQSIFKRWFVDFEFPNEDNQPYKSSGGEMVESELGMIPKEWEIGTLDNIGTFKNGKKIKSELRDDNGKYIIYGSNGIIGKTNEVLQNNNCIILGRVGAYCGSVQLSLEPCWITDNAIIATAKEEKYLPYLHRFLLNYPLRESAGGSAQPLINQSILKSIITTIPTQNLFEKYYNISKEILSKIDKNIKENNLLAEIRDSILPKLMSNEISI